MNAVTYKCATCLLPKEKDSFYQKKNGYRRKHCIECLRLKARKQSKEKYDADVVAARQKRRDWRAQEGRAHSRQVSRDWNSKNAEQVNAYNRARYHMRKRGATAETVEYMEVLLRNDPCAYCSETGGTIDHIIPVSKGGESDDRNLTSSCSNCNLSKGAKPMLLFMATRSLSP